MCERLSEVVCRRCIEVGSDASRMGRRRGGFLVWSMRSRFSWFAFGLEFSPDGALGLALVEFAGLAVGGLLSCFPVGV